MQCVCVTSGMKNVVSLQDKWHFFLQPDSIVIAQ